VRKAKSGRGEKKKPSGVLGVKETFCGKKKGNGSRGLEPNLHTG